MVRQVRSDGGRFANTLVNTKCKAHGDDLLHIGVLKVEPTLSARMLHPLLTKVAAYYAEPFGWTGDCRVPVPKPNKSAAPNEARGIALASSTAKLWHRIVRGTLAKEVASTVDDNVCGAVPGKGTEPAILLQQQFTEWAVRSGKSAAILFIDMSAAFDKVSRSQMQQALPNSWAGKATVAALETTWMVIPTADEPIEVNDGLRQGDPLSDIAYVATLEDALRDIRASLHAAGLDVTIQRRAARRPFDKSDADAVDVNTSLNDTEYIDDVAFFIAESAANITEALTKTTRTVHQQLTARGYCINYAPGKTEASVHVAGSKSRKVRQQLCRQGQTIDITDGVKLRLVKSYKHLGAWHSFLTRAAITAKQACNHFNASYAIITKKVFGNPYLDDRHKKFLISIALSKALYACAAWPILGKHLDTIKGPYLKLLRLAFDGQWRKNRRPATEKELYERGAACISLELRSRRLLALPRIIMNGSEQVFAIIEANRRLEAKTGRGNSWYTQAIEDMQWLYQYSGKCEDLGNPSEHADAWQDFMLKFPKSWKKIIKATYELRRQHETDDVCCHQVQEEPDQYMCQECGQFFTRIGGLRTHQRSRHGAVAFGKAYAAEDNACMHCAHIFPHRERLLQHYRQGWRRRASGSCYGQIALKNDPGISIERQLALDAVEAERRKTAKAKGRPSGYADCCTLPADKCLPLPVLGPLDRHHRITATRR
eukprot:TRINITY_DN33872_c0_g1_i1.p1 TRINITY_DN33872_c0_g1~~TRINITY_DN33872_c0_g1_i1.p1  ORF type:complete len:713 (+),score=127.53 TRINITY_DN33872_c0_g1_i1:263-2401(+)